MSVHKCFFLVGIVIKVCVGAKKAVFHDFAKLLDRRKDTHVNAFIQDDSAVPAFDKNFVSVPIKVYGREKDNRPFIFVLSFTSLHYVENIILEEHFVSKMVSKLRYCRTESF